MAAAGSGGTPSTLHELGGSGGRPSSAAGNEVPASKRHRPSVVSISMNSVLKSSLAPGATGATRRCSQQMLDRSSLRSGEASRRASNLLHRKSVGIVGSSEILGGSLGERTSSKITLDEELYDILYAFGLVPFSP
ncbi:hypothetical protein L596_014289 [Steinernema carpocapsae]|uniref:Uncharacterized protein n=1 Tax=Steinernema carpocapsae TaxID=34508 RepID=A0A4U5NCL0_STECR|nr:hypothetical protein L596_014289 [Steinernema carpocapsae]